VKSPIEYIDTVNAVNEKVISFKIIFVCLFYSKLTNLQIVGSGVFVKVALPIRRETHCFLYYGKDVVKAEILHFVQNDLEKLMYFG